MNICVLSCCYEKPHLASILTESCKMFGYELKMCEAAELNGVWPASGDMRVGKMVAALEGLKLIQETKAFTHALWADGFDTFIRGHYVDIARGFRHLGEPPMILSAEKNCWPDPIYEVKYPVSESPYRFINAGTWMGQIGYLIDVIGQLVSKYKEEPNDQRIWTMGFLGGFCPGAVIDTERKIFQTMWGTELADVSPDASVIHYNGGIWRNPEDRRMIDHWASVKAGL